MLVFVSRNKLRETYRLSFLETVGLWDSTRRVGRMKKVIICIYNVQKKLPAGTVEIQEINYFRETFPKTLLFYRCFEF